MSLPQSHPRLHKRAPSQGEIVADGVVHIAAILAGLIAFAALFSYIALHGSAGYGIATGIYAAGFFAMFGFSCAYNLTPPSQLKWLLRRFDHSAIYFMIAGTYTALLAMLGNQVWNWVLIGVIWAGALGGSAIKMLLPGRFDRLAIVLYLLMGWAALAAIKPVSMALPTATLVLVVVGGLLYSVGVIFYKWQSLKFQNAIWHGFVAAAAACHFAGIAVAVGTAA
ncbi:MAG: DNA-binding protein [Alphaproteobacteria bacterium HGW-Alphaproteobacteria-4]|jgi:hemolysin III|nr:MAG: DNA-binding protein [Alphaproteobacteria bacterium HGW-Alphaproteobacteria-4]